ncbi:DUF4158 domain-containing protein [Catenulispora pinisilvae]|uniref:DUF4158 domain-containing protein n=1 Tax=Catenulispora pinisilvae TaxID=2705253 RepID=UPI0034DD2083
MAPSDLAEAFTLSNEEIDWARDKTSTDPHLLALAVWLATYRRLGYFPKLEDVPDVVVGLVRDALKLPDVVAPEVDANRTAKRHRELVRRQLGVQYNSAEARGYAEAAIEEAAQTKDNPADLINVALDVLVKKGCELPGYSTLDLAAKTIRTRVNKGFFAAAASRIEPARRPGLDRLMRWTPPRGAQRVRPVEGPREGRDAGEVQTAPSAHAGAGRARPDRNVAGGDPSGEDRALRRGGPGHHCRGLRQDRRGQAADASGQPHPRAANGGAGRGDRDVLQADGDHPPQGPGAAGGVARGAPRRVRTSAGGVRRRAGRRPGRGGRPAVGRRCGIGGSRHGGRRRRHARCGGRRAGRTGRGRVRRCRRCGRARGADRPGRAQSARRRRRAGAPDGRAPDGGRLSREQLPAAAGAVLQVPPLGAVHPGRLDRVRGDQRGPVGAGRAGVRPGRAPPARGVDRAGRVPAARREEGPGVHRHRHLRLRDVEEDADRQAPAGDAGPAAPGGVRVLLPGRRAALRRHRGGRLGLLRQPAHPDDDLGGVRAARRRVLRTGRDPRGRQSAGRVLQEAAHEDGRDRRQGIPEEHRPALGGRQAGAGPVQGRRPTTGGDRAGGRGAGPAA